MNIFDIFTKKHSDEKALTVAFPTAATTETEEQVEPAMAQEEKKPLTVSYATGWPIDVVYGHLHKNYEGNGFEDAMVKSDMAFKDMNMKLIRNKILMVFREINLNYDVMKQDVKIRIDNCREAGLFTTVAELDKKMQLINAHKVELARLENDFRNNTNEASIPLLSYECGFLRGIATVALGGNKPTQETSVCDNGGFAVKQRIA